MELELTQQAHLTYPERDMDDVVEKVEEKLEETVGKVKSDAEKKEEEARLNAAKYQAVTQEQKEKARKAWEEWSKKQKEKGMDIPERYKKMQNDFIEKGIEPRHLVGGASDSHAFAGFDAEKYKGSKLSDIARELKEAGMKEEVDNQKLLEFSQRVDLMAQLGEISEDENQRFKSDINEIIVRIQGEGAGQQGQQEDAQKTKESLDQTGDMGFEDIRQMIADLTDPNMSEEDMKNAVDSLKLAARALVQPYYEKKDKQDKAKELNDILKTNTPSELQRKLTPFLDAAVAKRKKNYQEGKVEIEGREINSIQDLAKFIMNKQESALYGAFNKYALIDFVKNPATGETKEVFRPDNFLIWVRDQIIQLHDDNRTSEMQPLSAVAIETDLRTISIYMMQRFKGQYFRDAETGEIMTDLADSAVNMCYLFGFFRNMDLAYKQVMNSDEKTPEIISGIHAKNDVTHGDNWATFLSMPDRFGQAKKNPDGNVMRDEKGNVVYERDTRVGDAELIANDIYYNLSDLDELRDITGGEKGVFMTKSGFKKTLFLQQIAAGVKYEWDDGPNDTPGFYDKAEDNFYFVHPETKKRTYIFKPDGSLDEKNYLSYVNFFNAPTPDKTQVDFVRDLVRLTAAEKAGIESGLAKDPAELQERKNKYNELAAKSKDDADKYYKRLVNAARINTKFAEYSSFIQQRPLMVAARNDTNRRGYDASTKLDINYIIRQSGENTAGPIGSTEFLKHQIIKNFGVDFVAGLKTESRRSPYEIFRDMRHILNDETLTQDQKADKKKALMDELRFQDNAALDYSSNAIARAYQIFHQVTGAQGLDLDKIVTRNFFEGIKYNTAEFEKQIKDDFIKPMRYAFSSNSALKFGELYRSFEQNKNDMPVYKWKTLADHMFGDEVLDDIRKDAVENKLEIKRFDEGGKLKDTKDMTPFERYQEYLNGGEARYRIVKNISRARIAAELRKHRNRWGPAQRWNGDMVNKFIQALETIREFKKDENGNVVETGNRFFSPEDIAWIRKSSGTELVKMTAKELGASTSVGVVKGLGAGFKEFISDIFK